MQFKLTDSWQKLVSQCNSLGTEKYCYCKHLCSVVRCSKWYIYIYIQCVHHEYAVIPFITESCTG